MKEDKKTRKRRGVDATITMGILYILGFITLFARGHVEEAQDSAYYAAVMGMLALAASRFIPETTRPEIGKFVNRKKALLTLAVASIIIITYFAVAAYVEFGPHDKFGPFYECFGQYGVIRFLTGACLAFVIMRWMNVPNDAMGLGKPREGSRGVGYVWLGTATAFVAIDIWAGRATILPVVQNTFFNIFRNGFTEEYLFRGILLGRLRRVIKTRWAILAQALAFGGFHYPLDIRFMNGDLPSAIAIIICVQAVFGYTLGILTVRTRSVLIGSGFHAVADATDII